MTTDQQIQHESPVMEKMQYDDYWSFEQTKRYIFPDTVQWIEFQVMNEGQKSMYQKEINRDITINRRSGDAKIKSDIADERHALIKKSVVNWSMFRNGQMVPYSQSMFANWLGAADPRLVEALEFAIRKANPWLQGDMSVKDIDEELERLKELREEAVKREEGKDSLNLK